MTTVKSVPDDMHTVKPHLICVGAKVIMPFDSAFWGDRYGKLEDPFGHYWSVATHQHDLTPAEIDAAFKKVCA